MPRGVEAVQGDVARRPAPSAGPEESTPITRAAPPASAATLKPPV